MTKVDRQCTCWTGCKWTALIMFFCYCICCICLYTPFVRGGAIADYLECKCLHRSIVHKCGNNACQAIIKIYHPDIAGHKHTNKQDSDSEDSHSSYYDSEEDNDEVKAEEPEILFPESNKAEWFNSKFKILFFFNSLLILMCNQLTPLLHQVLH